MRTAFSLLAGPMLLIAGSATPAQPLQWQGQLAAASELTDRGLLIGPRRPSVQAGLNALVDGRWSLGLAASLPGAEAREGRLLASLSRYQSLSDDWQAEALVGYYGYPGNDSAGRFDRFEASLGTSYRDLLSLSVTALHYPAWPGRRAGLQWAWDLGLRWPLVPAWSVTASLGQADLPPLPDKRYVYGGLGLAWQPGDWRFEVNRLGADGTARRFLGDSARPRWSAQASWRF